ncbi:MAG: sodium:alanine symporter family protein [Gammaproteobacteria bacterium]|nr:sodium:alanine symporter family protein [Gammaproteobacteria bacterium]
MQDLANFLDWLDSLLGSALWFPIVLLAVGVWFTLYLGFPQLRYFRRGWRILLGKEAKPEAEGDTTHFQALSTALSGTVGTGNIGGVAFALFLGGPAALFWMWATAFIGMTTKFVEVTLSHKYRVKDDKGEIAGGPMYYMERKLNMKWLAVIFAVATIFSTLGSGNLPQSNNVAQGLEASFGFPGWATGLVLAGFLALIILGGIKRIANFASKVVPAMAAVYLVGAIAVIAMNLDQILPSFAAIFSSIFSGSAAVGGFLGASIAYAFTKGVGRGLFSNEAGQGSAPIAHASAKADDPVPEGLVSLLEPFIDTLIICTITGLVILSSGVWTEKFENDFERSSTEFIEGSYSDTNVEHVAILREHLGLARPTHNPIVTLNADIVVRDGAIQSPNISVIHNRSLAEDVRISRNGEPYTGVVTVDNGMLPVGYTVSGKSLIHSVALTSEAFKRGFFGDFGQYAVTVTLVLFAFTTAVAWSYYGDRAIVYLFGVKYVFAYRLAYTLIFFLGTILETSLVWKFSAVTLVLMALPNLIGITLLSRDMKTTTKEFFDRDSPQKDAA